MESFLWVWENYIKEELDLAFFRSPEAEKDILKTYFIFILTIIFSCTFCTSFTFLCITSPNIPIFIVFSNYMITLLKLRGSLHTHMHTYIVVCLYLTHGPWIGLSPWHARNWAGQTSEARFVGYTKSWHFWSMKKTSLHGTSSLCPKYLGPLVYSIRRHTLTWFIQSLYWANFTYK